MDDVSELKTLSQLKELYPNVTEPLPLCWSSTEKNNSIGLSNSNLRVHYKGTMIFTFSSSGSHPTAMSLSCSNFSRRWEVSQRCCVGSNDLPHPRQLWTLLLWGEDHLEGSGWVHGHWIDGLVSDQLQNEQIARWVLLISSYRNEHNQRLMGYCVLL